MSDPSLSRVNWTSNSTALPSMLGNTLFALETSISRSIATVSASKSSTVSIKGQGGKSARRRTRASQRPPTMLLNTDTTNFRAMVQQFTGIPSSPYSLGPALSKGPIINCRPNNFNEQPPQPTAVDHIGYSHRQLLYDQYEEFINPSNLGMMPRRSNGSST